MIRIIRVFLWLIMAQVSLMAHWAFAGEIALTRGQTVYVPVYSHIYSGDTERPFLLTAIVSIRNTDPRVSIVLTAVDYYDSEGKLVRKYLEKQTAFKGHGLYPLHRQGIGQTRGIRGQLHREVAVGQSGQSPHHGGGDDRNADGSRPFIHFKRSTHPGMSSRGTEP